MSVHPEFISGYDAANKAKQLIINSQLVELERLRAALKRAADALADGRDHLQEGEPRWERLDRAAQDAQVASMGGG